MIGVVACDAGGAEVVSSYLRRSGAEFECCLDGPARDVFARKFGEIAAAPLETLVETAEWILCGTSFPGDLEWRVFALARSRGRRCVAFLDHWTNFRQRFFRHGAGHFPDEIWVGDEAALEIAGRELPEVPAVVVENPYLLDVRDEISACAAGLPRPEKGVRVLYLCDPLAELARELHGDERHFGYVEEDALRYFLGNARNAFGDVASVVVRSHPREPRGKYAWAIREFPDLAVATDLDQPLVRQIAGADVVAGGATMAMVVALVAGKRVVSCIPPGGTFPPLPHKGIESLEELLAGEADRANIGNTIIRGEA